MQFFIEQVAICPKDPAAAKELLEAIGARVWHDDHVKGGAIVFGEPCQSEADLSFNYEMNRQDGKPLEVEILHYTDGDNWMRDQEPRVSHLGMHCEAVNLKGWIDFFAGRGIDIAQTMSTTSHTNPVIDGKRLYTYVIFDTYFILGVDLKFIVRQIVG